MSPSSVSSGERDSQSSEWQFFCFHEVPAFVQSSSYRVRLLPTASGFVSQQLPAAPQRDAAGHAERMASASAVTSAPSAEDGSARMQVLRGRCFFMRVGYWTYEVCPWRRVRQYHSENAAGGNAAVHSEFSLGTYAKGQDEWDAAKRLYSQRYTVGTEGRGTLVRFVCPESRREEDGIAIVHEPKPKQYLITMRVAALCHEARDDAAPAQQQRPAASARTTHAAAEVPRADVAPASMPAASASAGGAATTAAAAGRGDGPPRLAEIVLPQTRLLSPIRNRCFQTTKDYWTYELCPMRSVRQFRLEGARVASEFSLGKYEKQQDKLTVGVRGKLPKGLVPHVFTQCASLPPLPPSLPPSLLRSLPRSFPSPSPSPASRPRHSPSPFSAWPRAHLTLSPMSPHAQDVPERHQQPEGRRAGALRPQE